MSAVRITDADEAAVRQLLLARRAAADSAIITLPESADVRTCSVCWAGRAVAIVRGRVVCGPCGAEIVNGGEPGWSQAWD